MPGLRVGHVTKKRYELLVERGRDLVTQKTRAQFALGDAALEIEPLRPRGGSRASDEAELLSVSEALQMYADDISIPYNTLKNYRWVSARWPVKQRQHKESYDIHRILASIADEQERFTTIKNPPLDERTGVKRWTPDVVRRLVGWQVHQPQTVQERVDRIHDLANDDVVATRVATDFLRRPTVASKAMTDDTARHMVNSAQVDHARQAAETARQRTPAIARYQHTGEFLDLVGACSVFVASASRVIPDLRGHEFTRSERDTIHKNLARVRATCDWMESAVDTGNVTLEEGLARLLRDK